MLKKAFKGILMIQLSGLFLFMLYVSLNYSKSHRKCNNFTLDCTEGNISNRIFVKQNSTVLRKVTNTKIISINEVSSENCPKLVVKQNISDVDSSWGIVDATQRAFVYSAYHVNKEINKIVIIAAKVTSAKQFYCQFWYQRGTTDNYTMSQTSATVKVLPEVHGNRYAVSFIECIIGKGGVPEYVSIVTEKCQNPNNFIKVQSTLKPQHYMNNFTVCLSPLNLNYSKAYEFVEWVELNRILGANKFSIYKHSIAKNIEQVLDYYSKKGLVDVLTWNLPMATRFFRGDKKVRDIHYFGQVAALNDCLYRNKKSSKFVVNLDLDEFIIPHSKNLQTWNDIVNRTQPGKNVLLFRNTFFKKEWDGSTTLFDADDTKLIEKYKLVTLQKIKHEKVVFKAKLRSKYFARTSEVKQLMIHEVPGTSMESVPTDVALLHHYRFWGGGNESENMKVYDDTIPVKYGKQLLSRITEVWGQLPNVNIGI